MALVSLAVAKKHLRVDHDNDDDDISLKVDDATAIIMQYLKNQTMVIASVSLANPTVITTTLPHSLTSGASYTIAGTSTTPTVNGSQVVTVTGPTTFTVPVNVTIGEAESEGTISTPAFTETTVPGAIRSAVLVMLTHLHENRGDDQTADADLWDAIGRLLMRSRDPALA